MGASDDRVRVYKVGGSLFDWPELFERLEALLRNEPGRPLIVAGGGSAADVVRNWDRVHSLGETRAHRLAIASLRLSEAFLAGGLSRAKIVSDRRSAEAVWNAEGVPVLCAEAFLEAEETSGQAPLPASWEVTSDSIAAWIAGRWPADLVLLKSTTPLLSQGLFVDSFFPQATPAVRSVEWMNLRTGDRGPLEGFS